MKKISILILCAVAFVGCVASKPQTPGGKKIVAKSGRPLPVIGVSIDSNYDSRLDHVLKGYKLLPILMKNYSLKSIPMDVKNDRWVVIGEKGQKYTAVNSLRVKDPAAWRRLPEDVKNLIDYPEIIPIEYSVTFDLLMPSSANLEYFKEIRFYSEPLQKEIVIEKDY